MRQAGTMVMLLLLLCSVVAGGEKSIVAVFDIEKTSRVMLGREAMDSLADYIGSRLTESGAYSIVPRDQLKKRLFEQKKKSYKKCYDQNCQIEIGRELAAEKTLSTKIARLGKRCTVTLTLYDLKKSASEGAATQHGGCGENDVVNSVDKALAKLLGAGKTKSAKVGRGDGDPGSGLRWISSKPAGVEFTRAEITVAQYRACVDAGKCDAAHFDDGTCMVWDGRTWSQKRLQNRLRGDSQPVVCVDWRQAQEYCTWVGGRLPSEREWFTEASDAGRRTYPWGAAAPSCDKAIFKQQGFGCGRDASWPVCSKPGGQSVSGLCDMVGNVWEWTSGLSGNQRVMRGGSWNNFRPETLKSTGRLTGDPSYAGNGTGFRCVREVGNTIDVDKPDF